MVASPELKLKILQVLGEREMASACQLAARLGIGEFSDAAHTRVSPAFLDLCDTLDAARLEREVVLGIDPNAPPATAQSGIGPDTYVYFLPEQAEQLIRRKRVIRGEPWTRGRMESL